MILEGKVGIVTGAGSGIGRALALTAVKEGSRVVVADINLETAQQTVDLVKEAGGEAIAVKADVTDEKQVSDMVEAAIETYGQLDWAVNNASISIAFGILTELPYEEWQAQMDVTLKGVYLCMKHQLPKMMAAGGGNIVNIGSMCGLDGLPLMSAYAAAKGGVIALSKSAAAEYAPYGIRVNIINPGMIRTPGSEHFCSIAPEVAQKSIAAHALNRMGEPEEIAATAMFLCSEGAGFITGECIAVDGGSQVKAVTYPQ